MSTPRHQISASLLLALALAGTATLSAAEQTPGASAAERQGRAVNAVQPTNVVVDDQDARRTRESFTELLRKYPPALGRVLKLDPSLLGNQGYIAPYPALVSFLAQHPEVTHNPTFFLDPVSIGMDVFDGDRRNSGERMWTEMMDGIGFVLVLGTLASLFVWLVKTLVDYRRWHRLAKVQAEAHTKLLDRFTANEELVAYVQSPAGSQFLQSAPIALEPGSRRLGAPFGRILWSVQAGLVLAMAGIGFQYVSRRVAPDTAEPMFALGILALALGVGFVLSAGVAYALSQRLGLFERPASDFRAPSAERHL